MMNYEIWCKEADQSRPTSTATNLDEARREANRLASELHSDAEIVDSDGNTIEEILWEDAHWG